MTVLLMTQTKKDYKIASGRVTKTEVVDFSLFLRYDRFERIHCFDRKQTIIAYIMNMKHMSVLCL